MNRNLADMEFGMFLLFLAKLTIIACITFQRLWEEINQAILKLNFKIKYQISSYWLSSIQLYSKANTDVNENRWEICLSFSPALKCIFVKWIIFAWNLIFFSRLKSKFFSLNDFKNFSDLVCKIYYSKGRPYLYDWREWVVCVQRLISVSFIALMISWYISWCISVCLLFANAYLNKKSKVKRNTNVTPNAIHFAVRVFHTSRCISK